MKNKIQYINFKATQSEMNYLTYLLEEVSETYPELTTFNIKIVKQENTYSARIRGKYIKVDVTAKWSSPILLICINKLINNFEEKIKSASYLSGVGCPAGIQRSSIFKYVESYNYH